MTAKILFCPSLRHDKLICDTSCDNPWVAAPETAAGPERMGGAAPKTAAGPERMGGAAPETTAGPKHMEGDNIAGDHSAEPGTKHQITFIHLVSKVGKMHHTKPCMRQIKKLKI